MCNNHQKAIVADDTPAFFAIDRYGFPEAGEHPADPPHDYPPDFSSEKFGTSATMSRSFATASTGSPAGTTRPSS